ncbi:O-antigen ligase family protein [Paenibacillus borealis]|uniref:O-antigen ligase family protein n=1 Tax=Paenibacillus borealis TaxID=160799 RepID=UPI000694D43B|nr:O-antigen ligase family protein [Paenibacillus borealis]
MRMNRVQRYGESAVGVVSGLALIAAAAAACVLRGFFFAGEMYLFLTVWFVLCGVLAIAGLVLYATSGWGKRPKLVAALPGSAAKALALPGGVLKNASAEGAVEAMTGSGRLMTGDAGKSEVAEAAVGELTGSVRLMSGDVLMVAVAEKAVGELPGSGRLMTGDAGEGAIAEAAVGKLTGSGWLKTGDAGEIVAAEAAVGELPGSGRLMTGEAGEGAIAEAAVVELRGSSRLMTGEAGMGAVEVVSWSGVLAGRSLMVKAAILMLPGFSVVIFILYGIHALRQPISSQGTLNELLRWGLYDSFALFALLAAGARRGGAILAAVWHLLGLVISLSALLAVCGGLPIPYAVSYSQSPEVSATGARLAGLLQYPNTFGAVMAVFLLERLFAAAYEPELKEGKGAEPAGSGPAGLWLTAARLLPLFPYAAALLLSESRGAWLAAAAAGAAALLWKRQLSAPLLLAGAAPVAAAALLYRQLARTGLAVEPLPGLLLLAGFWAGALLAGLWLHRRSSRAAGWHRAAMLALAAGAWTAAASAVLLQVRARITGPSPTAAARGLFYRDAWKLAAEAPWLGRGGETWRHAYLAAQSRPYVGSQVHSGYLDILLNLGTAGLAAVLLLLLSAGWLVFKASPRLLPPLLVILLHSAVDFDWSYGLIWLLLLLLPAWALAETIDQPVAEDTAILTRLRRSWPYAGIAVLCALTLMLSILSFQMTRGADLYKEAARVSGDPAAQTALLQQSLEWNPREPQTAVALSRLLAQEQGTDLLQRSLKYSPGSAALHWELAGRYLQGSDPGEALYWVRRSLQADIFNAAKRMAAIEGMLKMAERGLAEGDRQRSADSAAAGLELLRQYSLLAGKELSIGRQHNDRGFRINKEAEAAYLRLRTLQALAILEELLKLVAR